MNIVKIEVFINNNNFSIQLPTAKDLGFILEGFSTGQKML